MEEIIAYLLNIINQNRNNANKMITAHNVKARPNTNFTFVATAANSL